VHWLGKKSLDACYNGLGEFGDSLGNLNALFSGLGLCLLSIALFFQIREFRLMTEEYREMKNAAKEQGKHMETTANIDLLVAFKDTLRSDPPAQEVLNKAIKEQALELLNSRFSGYMKPTFTINVSHLDRRTTPFIFTALLYSTQLSTSIHAYLFKDGTDEDFRSALNISANKSQLRTDWAINTTDNYLIVLFTLELNQKMFIAKFRNITESTGRSPFELIPLSQASKVIREKFDAIMTI